VRELQNVIERMMNFARANELTYDLIPGEIIRSRRTPDRIGDMESPEEIEKKLIKKMLDLKFHKIQIAEKLNVSRATLYRN
jgi:transcriptional regulator with PAS, ATPase and Fis domain